MIIGINGKSKSGKDTVADMLVEHYGFVKVALADEIKRTALRWWPAFTVEHMWGPSEMRNVEVEVAPGFFLSARHALQQIGTEVARAIDPDVWVRYTMSVVEKLLDPTERFFYVREVGVILYDPDLHVRSAYSPVKGVVIPDCRFLNEFRAIELKSGWLVRIKRPGAGLQGAQAQHQSEKEQDAVSEDIFDTIIDNSSDLKRLRLAVDTMMHRVSGRLIPYDEEQKDVPPFLRK